MRSIAAFLSFLLPLFVFSQDSLSRRWEIDLDIGTGLYYQFTTFGKTDFYEAKIPELLPRRANEPQVRSNWDLDDDLVTDNSFFHGSYFFEFGGKAYLTEGLSITASLTGEQRGFSAGVYNKNTLNIFPYLNAAYQMQLCITPATQTAPERIAGTSARTPFSAP